MVDKQMDKTSRQRDDDDDLKEIEDRLRSPHVRDGFGKETSGIVPQKEFPEKLADEQGAILKSDVGSYRREADDTETSLRSAQRSRKADEDSRIRCRTASICSPSCKLKEFSNGNSSKHSNSENALTSSQTSTAISSLEKAGMWHLPSDLLEEILLRVPVSSLVRFQMASRVWKSLFSGSSFINKHLKRGEKWFVHVRLSEVWVVENADKTCPRYRKIRDFDGELINSLVQCDGLILCSTMSQGSKGQAVRKLVVWDLNETRWLDKDNLSRYDFYLLGHDSNQLYKIVKFNSGAFDRDTDVHEPSMEIYDFYSNGWRSVDLTLPDYWKIPRPMMVVSLEGNSYWLAYSEGHRVVQSFDFSAEAFTAISLPPTVKGGILSLSSQGDQLVLLSQQCEQCSVWMKGREQVAQWEKLFQVTRGADQPDCGQSLLIKDKTIISFSEEVVENGTGSQVRISRIGQDEIGQFQTAIFRFYTRPSINSVYAPTLFHSLNRSSRGRDQQCLKWLKC
uniref:Putative F-box protein n=1 Tax=Noccaea caerulescens TaxID=107243 RepID=A0A1J3DEE7_NOCCA